MIKVKELIKKLEKEDPESGVFMEDAGESIMGSELTGCMGCGIAEAEDVRKIQEGVMITKY